MKNVLVLAVALAASGCATAPVVSGMAKDVPAERVLAYAEPREDYARVEITRDSGFLGSGCYLGVMYRQTLLARFAAGERAVFYIPEGDWNFAVVQDPRGRGLCGISENPAIERQSIRKGQDNLFRVSSGPYRRPRLLPF
ncbi:hypothetical protein [Neisseria musculi]|uniref:hypothetical protein n=1 Tax=Neisseria musculi TaxID=1815583 RepID=UPI00164B8D43|nr:hypothetical protein [Neisseria musculi]